MKDLIPLSGEIGNWSQVYDPQIAAGAALYQVINGGADIYVEYGFKEALFLTYSSREGFTINLEIYEMNSPEAAYGIYTFKRGEKGTPVKYGSEGWMESYYLNFIDGNYLVTVIGSDSMRTIIKGIRAIASAVDDKMEFNMVKPCIINFLQTKNLLTNGITYLRGNLALYNQYLFAHRDIFGLKEGVAGNYEDHTIFLFRYDNSDESKRWYTSAKTFFSSSNLFLDFTDNDSAIQMKDRNDNSIFIETFRNWIIIVILSDYMKKEEIISRQKARLE